MQKVNGETMGWSQRSIRQKFFIVAVFGIVVYEALRSQILSNAILDFIFGGVVPGTKIVLSPYVMLGGIGLILLSAFCWMTRFAIEDFIRDWSLIIDFKMPRLPEMPALPPIPQVRGKQSKAVGKPSHPILVNKPVKRSMKAQVQPHSQPLNRRTRLLVRGGAAMLGGVSGSLSFVRLALLSLVFSIAVSYGLLVLAVVKFVRLIVQAIIWVFLSLVRGVIFVAVCFIRLLQLVAMSVWWTVKLLAGSFLYLLVCVVRAVQLFGWSIIFAARSLVFLTLGLIKIVLLSILTFVRTVRALSVLTIHFVIGLVVGTSTMSRLAWHLSEPHLKKTDSWLEVKVHQFYSYLERKALFHPHLRQTLKLLNELRRQYERAVALLQNRRMAN